MAMENILHCYLQHQPCCRPLSQVFPPVPSPISLSHSPAGEHWSGPFISFFKERAAEAPTLLSSPEDLVHFWGAHLPVLCAASPAAPGTLWRSLAGFHPSSSWLCVGMEMHSGRKCFIWLGVPAGIYHLFTGSGLSSVLSLQTLLVYLLLYCFV